MGSLLLVMMGIPFAAGGRPTRTKPGTVPDACAQASKYRSAELYNSILVDRYNRTRSV
jgi:hypothetical protein